MPRQNINQSATVWVTKLFRVIYWDRFQAGQSMLVMSLL